MSESSSTRPSRNLTSPFLQRFARFFKQTSLNNKEQLLDALRTARGKAFISDESLLMLESVLKFTDLDAGDILVPYSRIDFIDIDDSFENILRTVITTTHSRFPVFEESRENILGILLAKDLLRCVVNPNITVRSLIRPAVFIPESKKIADLLAEFRNNRYHLALVIDEHGGISGLVTIEDILEEIVGDIEDEFDRPQELSIKPIAPNTWKVLASTEIEDFNQFFMTNISDEDNETIGGWIAGQLEHIPQSGEKIFIGSLEITVLRADSKRALSLQVQQIQPQLGHKPLQHK